MWLFRCGFSPQWESEREPPVGCPQVGDEDFSSLRLRSESKERAKPRARVGMILHRCLTPMIPRSEAMRWFRFSSGDDRDLGSPRPSKGLSRRG